MSIRLLQYCLWIAPHLLQVLVLILILRRGIGRLFPLFLGYTIFELIQFLLLFTLSFAHSVANIQYYWTFVAGSWISTAFRFGIIYELIAHMFRDHPALRASGKPIFRWFGVILFFVAAVSVGVASGGGTERVRVIFSALDLATSILQGGLLLVLLLFSRIFQISWRSYVIGIALGFGIFSCVELAAAAMRGQYGRSLYIDLVTLATYQVCVLVWLIYLLVPEQTPKLAGKGLRKSELEFWDQELQRMVRR